MSEFINIGDINYRSKFGTSEAIKYIVCFTQYLNKVFEKFSCTGQNYMGEFCIPANICIQVNQFNLVNCLETKIGFEISMPYSKSSKKYDFRFNHSKSLISFGDLKKIASNKILGCLNQNTSKCKESKFLKIRPFIYGRTSTNHRFCFFGKDIMKRVLIYSKSSIFRVMKIFGNRGWRACKENQFYPKSDCLFTNECFMIGTITRIKREINYLNQNQTWLNRCGFQNNNELHKKMTLSFICNM